MKEDMTQIVGNNDIKGNLCRDILSDSLSHAYILEGSKGSGRHTFALMAAAALSCENKDKDGMPLPCLVCRNCKKILEKKSPDVIFVGREDGKATIGVDTVRFLKDDVRYLPNDLEHKVYVVEETDKMTEQAQNALLLTLEEPPSFVHFFLLCNSANGLLETIKSRAPILRMQPVSESDIDGYICAHDRRAEQMKLSSPDEYGVLLKSASGGIGRALELLEPKEWKAVMKLRAPITDLINCAVNREGAKKSLPILLGLSKKRESLTEELSLMCSALRDLIILKKSEDAPLSFYCDRDAATELCDKASLPFLYGFLNSVLTAIDENGRNANVRLLLLKMAVSADIM